MAFRETITAPAETEGKYKKQTGGHDQFGVAFITPSPSSAAPFRGLRQDHQGGHPPPVHPAAEKGIAYTMAGGGCTAAQWWYIRASALHRPCSSLPATGSTSKRGRRLMSRPPLTSQQAAATAQLANLHYPVPRHTPEGMG